MKNKLTIVAAVLLIASCSKTDIQPKIESNSIEEGRIRPGEKTIIWDDPKGTYPNLRTIIYNKYRLTPYETHDGTKFTYFKKSPKEAVNGDTTGLMKLGEGYQVGYGSQLDTTISWKTLTGYTATIFRNKKTDEQYSVKRIEGRYDDVSVIIKKLTIKEVTDSISNRTGYGNGADTLNGVFSKWEYEILEPLECILGYKYPVKGVEKFIIDVSTIKVINYGNGEKDNKGTVSINGGKPEPITFPYSGTPILIGDEDLISLE